VSFVTLTTFSVIVDNILTVERDCLIIMIVITSLQDRFLAQELLMINVDRLIDFNSHIPYYIQLMDVIKEKIQNGEWKHGEQIPSEPDLCNTYGVSRTVVRQALRELEIEGLIIRRKGKGTFIAEPKISEGLAQKLTGFYQDMVDRGLNPVTQVLEQNVVPAGKKVAGFLNIEPETRVIVIERLRFINDEPIVLVTSYLPYDLCPQIAELDLSNRSLYESLEKECGLRIAYGRRVIEAVAANEREAELLQVDPCVPLILLDSVSFLEDGTPIEYYHALHRGDRSRFEVELFRIRERGQQAKAHEIEDLDLPSSNTVIV
jgi:GntR family transcriptional regulator